MVGVKLIGAQRIGQHDMQVRPQKWKIVVAAVPQQDVGLAFGLRHDRGIIDAREHDIADGDVGFVFLSLFNRAVGVVKIIAGGEALNRLAGKIAIGHGVAQNRDAMTSPAQAA